MKLLEISYKKNIQLSHYENLNSVVIGALFNIAIITEENLHIVKSTLLKFINNNRDKYSDIRFLILTYERMDSQYYMNKVQQFTIKEVKEKLSLLKI